jgi:pSer/pThr/pTyr-binding forkhead associated (FHA) protein
MGRIVLSTGDVVDLTRPAVIGRNPKIEGRLTGELPQTLKLDVGQALSRSHTMIRLEGWQVLAEDLGSANGTFVTLPGRPPQRLHPGEPVLLEPGSVIDLGGEVTGTYDIGG